MSNISFSSVNELKVLLKEKNLQKILLICGENSFEASGASKILKDLLKNKELKIFKKKFSYPELNELNQIIESLKDFSPDLMLAVGGGSVIDYAKTANVLTESKNLKNEILNSNYEIKKKFTKLAVIPTTAGSGAEVTANAVIYIDKVKYSVEGNFLRPDFFFLIPELVITGSNKIKSSAGFDAIAQAIESLISKKSNDKSVSFAKQSLEISFENYLNYLNNPNIENTSAMCFAANLAGEAISISKTTAPHAVSYPFTSIYGVSHGHAVSLTLNKFLKFNYVNIKDANCNFDLKERFKIIFDIAKLNNINDFDKFLDNLKSKAKLENNFKNLGIDIKNDYSKIISGVNMLRLSNNPIELNPSDLKKIIIDKSL